MPRRHRRHTGGSDIPASRKAATEQALTARINATFKKILVALQDQRDLRCDLANTRTRALLLDSEYVVLHAEYERALAARDKLDALSRELARQNKIIDHESQTKIQEEKKMREDIVHRFNLAMNDINKKLARQSSSREQRDLYVENLQNKFADLEERYLTRQQHFDHQIHRISLESRLAEAKKRQADRNHRQLADQLQSIREQLKKARAEHEELSAELADHARLIHEGETYLSSTEDLYQSQSLRIEHVQEEVKQMQTKNATIRKQNSATMVHIKAMETERNRLRALIKTHQDVERTERTKAEALDKLCKQVTCERSELHSEILVMQDAWTKLKHEIETLKDQVGDGNRVFEVLENIMSRESLDVAVTNIMKSGKTIEDVINDQLGQLRLAASASNPVLPAGAAQSSAPPHAASDGDPPG